MIRIALIGDLHYAFDDADVIYFNRSDYDLLLFVGDLGKALPRAEFRVARRLSRLTRPALLIPGNHDVANVFQKVAEIYQVPWLMRASVLGHAGHARRLARTLAPVVMGGYSTHPFDFGGCTLDVVAARPYSQGGSQFNYWHTLARRFGVRSLADSAELLRQCVDQTHSDRLIFLAHNGPFGLGSGPTDLWGADFTPEPTDWGDHDLRDAVAYARAQGKRVLAVVAGHMHQTTKRLGLQRRWCAERDGVHYFNVARVPRIAPHHGRLARHHVRLTIEGERVSAEERFVPADPA